ncbi:hypothetical protein PG997_010310 [Apiospora hydei]|uniref:BTB domain-containing protein n=1 Tax=Apiospora hydei TaxID=1337664 RepID=A0ABR1VWN6_9PEZI
MEGNEILHEIDPDGDIKLILRNPNAPFAVWDEDSSDLEIFNSSAVSAEPAVDENDKQENAIRFRLSTKHLDIIRGGEKEGNVSTIEASGWDPDALLILMEIIHGRHRGVPRRPGLEKIAKIAVLVDYYGCHEVVECSAERWTELLKDTRPKQYGRDLVLWLAICYVFYRPNIFWNLTRVAIKDSRGPIQTLKLSYHSRRQDALNQTITRLHGITIYFDEV